MRAGADTKEGIGPVNQDEWPGSQQAKADILNMSQQQLQAELDKARRDLDDLEELRSGSLGQTGVHIGMRVLKSARRQFEREEARLKERIALLEELLRRGHYHAGEESPYRG
ncbi:MAG: hypothetical protein HY676_05955 [Chloroflexi bacterium]|nr:hypothetical protein [Chloroflexota bacterium]